MFCAVLGIVRLAEEGYSPFFCQPGFGVVDCCVVDYVGVGGLGAKGAIVGAVPYVVDIVEFIYELALAGIDVTL